MTTKVGSTKIVNFITPRTGFFVLGRFIISQIVKMQSFFKSYSLLPGIGRQIKYVVMITKEGFTKIVNFMTPAAGVLILQGLYLKFKYVVMMTMEGSSKIVNFMTPRTGVLVLGLGHISHIVKLHYFFKIFFSTRRYSSDKPNV